MQANNSSRFLKNFMIGLMVSSAGAFIALSSSAMPEPAETGMEIDAVEEVSVPTATEALPTPGSEVLETVPAASVDSVDSIDAGTAEVGVTEADMAETEMATEEDVAEDATEAVAADEMTDEMPVAESDALETDADMVDAADAVGDEPAEEEVVEADEAEEMPVADEVVPDEAPVATEEDLNTADFTIAELTDNSDSFEILAAALAAADLTEILGGEGPFTVFAPTDDAFAALPEGSVDQLLLPENKDVLVQVLTYHVVPGAILSTDLEDGSVATVEGSEVEIAIADTVTVNNANVVAADIEASNGVIHVIDRVIIPPSPEADANTEADETAAAIAE